MENHVTEHDQPPGGTPFESNPFASPQTATGPAAWDDGRTLDRGLSWLLFSFQGRIPRRNYWAVTLGLFAVFMVVENPRGDPHCPGPRAIGPT